MQQQAWWRNPIFWIGLFVALIALGYWGLTRPKAYSELLPTPLVLTPPPSSAHAAVADLLASDPPVRDLADLTQRFRGLAAPAVAPDARVYPPQATALFWVKDATHDATVQIEAVLRYQSDALNFWVEQGARVRDKDIAEAAQRLEQSILPTTRAFFGTEWQPGVDNDFRVNILHVREIGGSGGTAAGGYFSAACEFVSAVNPSSNQR